MTERYEGIIPLMLGKDIPKDISLWESSKIRCYLISKTAGFKILVRKLKEKHKLSKLSKKAIIERLDLSDLLNDDLANDINKYGDELNLPDYFLGNILIDIDNANTSDGDTLPIYISSGEPMRDGFYIRVDRFTNKETIEKSFSEIKRRWKIYDKLPSEPENRFVKRTRGEIISRDRKKKIFEGDISAFVLIERYIYKFATTKRNMGENDKKGDKRIISEAIDEVSQKLVEKKIVKKKTYIEQTPNTKNNYRRLLKKYNIPAFSDFRNNFPTP